MSYAKQTRAIKSKPQALYQILNLFFVGAYDFNGLM